VLRPDLSGGQNPELSHDTELDEIDLLRSQEYGLLSNLIANAPTQDLLDRLSRLGGDASPLGQAHRNLAVAARTADADAVSREYFDLFVGIGRGELLPYASYYLTGFLNERPLARVREDLEALGIETSEDVREPEDHVGILCEIMSGLAGRRFGPNRGGASLFREAPEAICRAFLRRSRDRDIFAVLPIGRGARAFVYRNRSRGIRDRELTGLAGGWVRSGDGRYR
jgi:TorA maturation chaperone TorD